MKKIAIYTLVFALMWLSFTFVETNVVLEELRSINKTIFLATFVFVICESIVVSYRLKLILSYQKNLPISYVWALNNFGMLLSTIFPFSAGGISMMVILRVKDKLSKKFTIKAVMIDFLIGFTFFILFGFLGSIYFLNTSLGAGLDKIHIIAIVVTSCLAVVITYRIVRRRVDWLKLTTFKSILFTQTVDQKVIQIILLTFIFSILWYTEFYLYFLAFGVKLNIVHFFLAISFFNIFNLVALVPSRLGQYEITGLATLPILLGLSDEKLFAILIFKHSIAIITALVMGAVAIRVLGESFGKLRDLIS